MLCTSNQLFCDFFLSLEDSLPCNRYFFLFMAWIFINLWVFCSHLKLNIGHPLDIEKILSKPSLDDESNAYFYYFSGEKEWYMLLCQHWHVVVVSHNLWEENSTKEQHPGFFFFSLCLFFKNSGHYFSYYIPDTVHRYKYNMFFTVFFLFWVDIKCTLKLVPFFFKRIGHFSAKWLHNPVRFHCLVLSLFSFKDQRSLTKSYEDCTERTHHRGTGEAAWISSCCENFDLEYTCSFLFRCNKNSSK